MKNLKYGILVLAVIILGVAAWLYFGNNNPENEEVQTGQEEIIDGFLQTDEFSIKMPETWQMSEYLPTGIKAMGINATEEGLSQEAVDLGFVSYFSVSSDTLGDMTKEGYIELVKEEILNLDPNAVFSQENEVTVNDLEAIAMEIEMAQQGVSFKVLMAFIWSDQDIWGISFNTTKEKWPVYQDLAGEIVNSFKLK
jgi:hypothetical protein